MNLNPFEIAAAIAAFVVLDLIAYALWSNRAALVKLLKDCITENDGQSYDVIRVITLLVGGSGFPTFLGLAIYSVYASPEHRFDMTQFGMSMAAILGGLCAAAVGVGQKQKTDQ